LIIALFSKIWYIKVAKDYTSKRMSEMKILIYAKLSEDLSVFDNVIDLIKTPEDELLITTESRRAFRELKNIKTEDVDLIIISSLNSLGLNDADIATQLSWFIDNSVKLVVCEITSTYEFGISQPMNKAILNTVLHSILSGNKNIVTVSFKRSNSGRSKLPLPDNWEELYEKWQDKEITSKEFMEKSGLKKATFYNVLTEYKEIQKANAKYLKRYKIV
jgi:DNA invertase Pin-like site-specific DNA recombinase